MSTDSNGSLSPEQEVEESRVSSVASSNDEDRKKLDEALKKRKLLIERIKAERAKVVGLSRLTALKKDLNDDEDHPPPAQPQQRPASEQPQPRAATAQPQQFENVQGNNGMFPPLLNQQIQSALMPMALPLQQLQICRQPGDWKKCKFFC